eukprot:4644059-Amphidinium_carterae.1
MSLCTTDASSEFLFEGQGIVYLRTGHEQVVVIDAHAAAFTDRMVWHLHADQGPKSYGAFLYLQSIGLRLTISPDVIHRLLNDWHSGVRAAGLHTHRLEWKAVLVLRQGPWKQGAHHSLLRACAAELDSEGYRGSDVIFHWLFDEIALECGESTSPEYGSEPHIRRVWAKMMERLLTAGRTEHRMGRWFSWEHRSRALVKNVGLACTLYLIAVTGLRKRWWLTFQTSPLFDKRPDAIPVSELGDEDAPRRAQSVSATTPANAGEPASAAQADHPEGAPEADPDETTKQEAKKKAGNFHLAARVIASSLSRRLNVGVAELSQPLELHHSRSIAALKSPATCRELLISLHAGSLENVVRDMGRDLMSPALAQQLRMPTSASTAPCIFDDVLVSSAMFRLWCHASGALLCSSLQFQKQPPWCFIGLLSADKTTVANTADHLDRLWDCLRRLETGHAMQEAGRDFHRTLVWSSNELVREWFLLWKDNSPVSRARLVYEIGRFSMSWGSTVLAENSLRDGRILGARPTGILSPAKLWHRLHTSTLATQYGRSGMELSVPEPSTVTSVRTLPDAMFTPDLSTSSLGEDEVDGILVDPPRWPSMTPHEQKNATPRMLCLMHCNGDMNRVGRCWRSLLVQPGDLVYQRGSAKLAWVALWVTQYGFIAARCTLAHVQNTPVVMRLLPDDSELQFVCVEDWQQFKCTPLRCLPAGHDKWKESATMGGLLVFPAGKGDDLIQVAVKRGLPGWTQPQLKRLYHELATAQVDSEKSTPTTAEVDDAMLPLDELLKGVARRVIKHIDASALDEIVRAHDDDEAADLIALSAMLDLDEISATKESVDENEEEWDADLDDYIHQVEAARTKVARKAAAKPKPTQKRESKTKKTPELPTAQSPIPWRVDGPPLSAAEVEQWLPPNSTLTHETTWYNRFKLSAPYLSRMLTKVYSERTGYSSDQALFYCIAGGWRAYASSNGGAEAPFPLDMPLC